MRSICLIFGVCLNCSLWLGLTPSEVSGQGIQLPVVQQVQVDTVVTVPDRGAARIGGVSTAGSARNGSGLFRPGTSTGSYREASVVETHVWIHDFESMDRALLEQAPVQQTPVRSVGRATVPLTSAERQRLQFQQQRHSTTATANSSVQRPSAAEILKRHRGSGQLDARWALTR